MADSPRSSVMFPRWLLNLVYALLLALLAYFIYGASNGHVTLAGRNNGAIIYGSGAWPACFFPLGLIGYVAVRHDPWVNLDAAIRTPVAVACHLVGLAGIVVAVFMPT